jgi:hypothetical protein
MLGYALPHVSIDSQWVIPAMSSRPVVEVSEMRIDYGPGYRVYYARTDRVVYLLLCGGTKATQYADIKRAMEMNAMRIRQASDALGLRPKKRK